MSDTGSQGSSGTAENRSARGSFVTTSAPVMEGVLYKERDHFKGWRPRYFVLDTAFLHYYLQQGDDSPRDSLQLLKDVEVTNGSERVSSKGVSYHIFYISHPKIRTSYRLSTQSKADCAAWVGALRKVISTVGRPRYMGPVTDAQRLLKRGEQKEGSITSGGKSSSGDDGGDPAIRPVHREDTHRGIPHKYRAKIESAAKTLLQGASDGAPGWVPMFEKPGVVATRMAGSGGAICVRGETTMPYTIPEIYAAIASAKARLDLDHQLETYERKQWFSYHTGVEYLRFKPVWPTAARDFCNLTHWRLLEDGTFITFGFSAPFAELCPQTSGLVRADLIIGGYVMRPVAGGTRVHIIVQSDLCGSIPATVASLAAQSQPMVLVTLRKRLDTIHKNGKRPKFTTPVVSYYSDIIAISKLNTDAPFPDLSAAAGEASGAAAAPKKDSPADPHAVVHRTKVLVHLPPQHASQIDKAAQSLLLDASPRAEGWEPMFEKPGVVATKKAGSGGAICVRGEATLPFTIAEIFDASSTAAARKALDSQLHTYTRLKWFSRHTGVEYLRFKPVWPTAPRDFCNLTHWRLLEDGTFITFGFSTPFPDLCPEESGMVRANLILAGYVMRPVVGGTNIFIVVQTDLGGSLPASIANMAAQDQPMALVKLRKRLEGIHAGQKRPSFDAPVLTSYDDLIAVTKRNKDAPYPDTAGETGRSEEESPEPAAKSVCDAEEEPAIPVSAPPNRRSTNVITLPNLMLLVGLPVIVYYSIVGKWYCWVAVALSFFVAVEWVMKRHLGTPTRQATLRDVGMVRGRHQFQFTVDISRLAAYGCRGIDPSVRLPADAVLPVVVKAVSKALAAVPRACGHVANGYFYPSGEDVNVILSTDETRDAVVTIEDAATKSLRAIAGALRGEQQNLSASGGQLSYLKSKFPFWMGLLNYRYCDVGSAYRMTLPFFGGEFPTGVASVILHPQLSAAADTAAAIESPASSAGGSAMQSCLLPDLDASAAPVAISVGRPAAPVNLSDRRSLQERNECVVVVGVDARLASTRLCTQLAEKINAYMNSPTLLDV